MMEYHFETDGNVQKVYLTGRLVASCSEEFKDAMFARLKDAKKVLFNLEKMDYVDSSGLGALVSILQWMNTNGGAVKLCSVQPRPKIVFDITKVYRIFDIYEKEADAMAAFASLP